MNQQIATNTDVDDYCFLKPLIDHLNIISQCTKNNYILEICHLTAFPPRNVILPFVKCSPRVIIEHIINMHALTEYNLIHNIDNLQSFVYKYNYKGRLNQFEFSSNMSLDFDIITLCYLHLWFQHGYQNNRELTPILNKLSKIMTNKYQIHLLRTSPNYVMDEHLITGFQIANSFPSIWYPLVARYMEPELFIFPNYFIPRNYTLFMLPSIIPKLKSSYNPIPVLIAIVIKKIQKYNSNLNLSSDHSEYSLDKIYNFINELYSSEAFPKCFKLKLCEMWEIVFRKNNKYDYNLLFLERRDEAINIIESYSPDSCVDPFIIKILLPYYENVLDLV